MGSSTQTSSCPRSWTPVEVPESCDHFLDCRLRPRCYARGDLHFWLTRGRCVCSLNEKQRILAGKPLRRATYRDDRRVKFLDVTANFLYFAAEKRMAPRRSSGRSGQLMLVMIRVSSTVDRFLQMGIVSIARVVLTRSAVANLFLSVAHLAHAETTRGPSAQTCTVRGGDGSPLAGEGLNRSILALSFIYLQSLRVY